MEVKAQHGVALFHRAHCGPRCGGRSQLCQAIYYLAVDVADRWTGALMRIRFPEKDGNKSLYTQSGRKTWTRFGDGGTVGALTASLSALQAFALHFPNIIIFLGLENPTHEREGAVRLTTGQIAPSRGSPFQDHQLCHFPSVMFRSTSSQTREDSLDLARGSRIRGQTRGQRRLEPAKTDVE
ncbi:hypothetical protein CSPX01_04560 [Colletotrichum filicis]|nr:hypothetical protein CSPX01_04560 [Colletotrichum filicis]